jgi:phage host-nuclease inhibitor protein Gam
MTRTLFAISVTIAFFCCGQTLWAQDSLRQLPKQYLTTVQRKAAAVEDKIDRQTERYLNKLAKREEQLRRKLARIDSAGAAALFNGTAAKYKQLKSGIHNKTAAVQEYIPRLDSLGTSLKFLQANNGLINASVANLSKSLQQVQQLQSKLGQTEQVKQFIKERKEQIKQALQRYTKLPKGIGKQLERYNKQAYYYAAQIREYKEMLNSPEKIERKALELLNKIPAFQQFMKQNSMLAGLFEVPSNYGSSLAGLQTRASVQGLIQQRMAAMGPGAAQTIQQNIQAAQSQLNQLKNKFSGTGNTGDMPDFKPNNQKTKSFLQRLEYGFNFTTAKTNYYFPNTADIGLSLGYRINDKSVAGVGMSYKMGLGKGFKDIRLSNEGIGLRSFLDWKLKGSLYISGGYELNYRARFYSVAVLKPYSAWQRSALLGISKKYSVSKKLKGNMQLLYDFLWKEQVPVGEKIKFRIGYNF